MPAGLGWADLGVMPASLSGQPSNFSFANQRDLVMDTDALWAAFTTAPSEQDVWSGASQGLQVELPRPDGTTARFALADSPIMAPELAAQFPEIRTWSAQGIDDPAAVARIAMTPLGFDAVVLSPTTGSWAITPYYNLETQYYVSYFNRDVVVPVGAWDNLHDDEHDHVHDFGGPVAAGGGDTGSGGSTGGSPPTAGRSGLQLRTYRMAVAATGEFTQAHGGNVAGGLAGVVVDVNQMNAIYENDFTIRLQLVANNNSVIYTDSNSDPYSNGNHGTMLGENQSNLDNVIGSANYDIGHVFGFGNGGGLAGLGVVGNASRKGQAVSEDVNFIPNYMGMSVGPHEVGHQFNANHTFNSSNDNNRNAGTAYENGSGATIMSYAGLISGDNYLSGNFAAFNASAFDEVIRFVDTSIPTVGTRTTIPNAVPSVNGGNDFVIPARSFFELVATASDANAGDSLTYSWEQRDLGAAALHTDADNGSSPLFRVFPASPSPSRYFPQLSDILNNTSTAGEQLFTRNRTSNFRVTVRDNRAGGGAINTDDVTLTVVDTGAPFRLTAPNTAVSWTGKTSQTVTWNVAGTTGNGINAANVRIRLSTDGGLTYPITVVSSTPNTGSATITVPNVDTNQARLRVEGVNNVFFDISDTNFTVIGVPGVVVTPVAGLTTTEAGGTATFTVRLETRPTGIVSIPISSSDTTEGTVSVSTLTFTTANWNTPQTVTITGVDDLLVDGDVDYQITTGKASSSDSRYNNMIVADVDVVNINDDFAGFEVVPGNLVTTEKGATASFSVRLITAPAADVILPLSSSNTAEGTISPASLTFTPGNWNVAQTVTVAGVDDLLVDADVGYFAVLGVATSADTEYDGLNPDDIQLTNRNDDTRTTVVALGSNFRYAQPVNFRATVTGLNGHAADGKVTFTSTSPSGTLDLGTFSVVAGIANVSTPLLPLDMSTVTATFSNDSFFLDSAGNTTVNILPAFLTVTANPRTKTYGATLPTLTYTATGFVDGDTASIFTGGLATTGSASSNVGTYPISLGTLSAGAKYEIQFTANSLTVTRANLTVTAAPATKVYGDALPPLNYTPAGFVNGDTATVMSGSLSTPAGASSNVGVYPIQQNTVSAGGNYNINYNGASLAITPAALTVTPNAQTKQYGPAAVPALTYNTAGFVNGDTASILTGGLTTTALATSPVGTYPILPGTLSATGGNYNLGILPADVTITPAPLTVAAINATARLGDPIPAFNYGVSGLVNGDKATVVSGVVLTTPATPDVTKGNYPIVVTGGTASNYSITRVNGVLTLTLAATLVGEDEFTVGTDGGSGVVTQYNASGTPINSFFPYPDFSGAVRTATGDITGDGVPDVVVGTGPGTLAAVRLIDGATGGILQDIIPFDEFTGGVFVAVGDMTGDGKAEFVVTPDVGGGPRVTIYRGGTFETMLNFFGIDDQAFRGGARSALGDINGDGAADLIIAAGFGGGPRISLLDGKQLSNNNIYGFLTSDFFAFSDALRDGVYVTAGDVNGDGFAEVIIGAGPGGGPRVLVLSGRIILDEGGPVATRRPIANFFAGDPNSRNGVFVSARNLDDDAKSDLVIGGGSVAIGYRGSNLANNQALQLFVIDADTGPTGGVFVG